MKKESVFEKVKRLIFDPDFYIRLLLPTGIFNGMSDERYLKMRYKALMKERLNLDNPITYNEKIQWLKIHDRKPIYTQMVDKYLAKKYIAERVGEKYVVPTIGVYDSFDDIDFDKLPDRFVLKCTHDSGGLVLCKDKANLDIRKARDKIEKSLKRKFYYVGREWPYKNVKPRIIAEEYLSDGSKSGALTDYKFFCFDGEPQIMYYSNDKAEDPRTDFFDMEKRHLDLRMKDPHADEVPSIPESFNEMKELARKLSQDMIHLRVDFYYIAGRVYVGELTFYHMSGFSRVYPQEWAIKLGDYIKLPI